MPASQEFITQPTDTLIASHGMKTPSLVHDEVFKSQIDIGQHTRGPFSAAIGGVPRATIAHDGSINLPGPKNSGVQPQSSSVLGSAAHETMLFGEGLVSGALFNPLKGVEQVSNHVLGTQFDLQRLDFSNQKEVDSSIAGHLGEFGGTALDVVGITLATGGLADTIGIGGLGGLALRAGTVGAVQGGLLTPTADNNFVTGRLENGAIGFVAGAAAVAGGAGVSAFADRLSNTAAITAARIVGGMSVGSTVAMGTTEAGSLINSGELAATDQIIMAAAIGGAGGLLGAISRPASKANLPTDSNTASEGTAAHSIVQQPGANYTVAPEANSVAAPEQLVPNSTQISNAEFVAQLEKQMQNGRYHGWADYGTSKLQDPAEIQRFAQLYAEEYPNVAIHNMQIAAEQGRVVPGTENIWNEAISKANVELSIGRNQTLFNVGNAEGGDGMITAKKQFYNVNFRKATERMTVPTLENHAGELVDRGQWIATRLNEDGMPVMEDGIVNQWPIPVKTILKQYSVAADQLEGANELTAPTKTDAPPVHMVKLATDTTIHTPWGTMSGQAGDWLANYDYDPATGTPGRSYAIITARSFGQTYQVLSNGTPQLQGTNVVRR